MPRRRSVNQPWGYDLADKNTKRDNRVAKIFLQLLRIIDREDLHGDFEAPVNSILWELIAVDASRTSPAWWRQRRAAGERHGNDLCASCRLDLI